MKKIITKKTDKDINKELFPKFIIAGFPRCGTTALVYNLSQHPGIHIPRKELWFFQKPIESFQPYLSNFKIGKVNGEKTPVYVFKKNTVERISKAIPDVKIILCIRHPIQALHSFYNWKVFEYNSGFLDRGIDVRKLSFEKLVLDEIDFHWLNVETGCFIKHITQNVMEYFDKAQVKICVQERMLIDPEKELKEIFSFIGVDPIQVRNLRMKFHDEKFKYKSIDYGSKKYSLAIEKLLELYKPYNEALFNFLGENIKEWHFFDRYYKRFLK